MELRSTLTGEEDADEQEELERLTNFLSHPHGMLLRRLLCFALSVKLVNERGKSVEETMAGPLSLSREREIMRGKNKRLLLINPNSIGCI